jgi:hypothetical protein
MEYVLQEKYHNKMAEVKSRKIKYIITENGCWECISHPLSKDGYPRIVRNRKTYGGHRYSYLLHYNKIPDGLHVLHKCDNRLCINPEHLFLGTHKDNMQDMIKKGRAVGASGRKQTKEEKEKRGMIMSKLSTEQLFEIKKLLLQKISTQKIADLFGTSYITINNIKKGNHKTYSRILNGGLKEWSMEA